MSREKIAAGVIEFSRFDGANSENAYKEAMKGSVESTTSSLETSKS
jgi:hypothetical protein